MGGLDTTTGPSMTNVAGTVQTTNTQMDLGATTMTADTTLSSGTGAINVASITDGASSFALSLQADTAGSTGLVTFLGNVTVNTLTTFNRGYGIRFEGSWNVIDTDTNFLSDGGLWFGNGTGDRSTFTGGLDTTGAGGSHRLMGILETVDTQMDLAAIVMDGNATIRSGSGAVNIAAINDGSNGYILSLGSGTQTGTITSAGTMVVGTLTTFNANYAIALNGTFTTVTTDTNFLNDGGLTLGNGAGDTLTFVGGLDTTGATGTLNVAGIIQTTDTQMDLGAATMTAATTLCSGTGAINVASVTDGAGSFALSLGSGTQTGAVTILGNATINTLTTFSSAYQVVMLGSSNVIDTATAFINTNGVVLGNNANDVFLFDGGLTSTVSTTTLFGKIRTSADIMTLGAVLLSGTTVLDTTNDGGNAAGAAMNIVTVNGAAAVTLNAGTAGDITVSGAIGAGTPITSLTITNANDVSLQAVTTTGVVTQTTGTGTTTLNGLVTAGGNVNMANDAITFSGATAAINAGANDVTLTAETGAITGGSAATDITGNNLTMNAVTGMGTSGNHLLTAVSGLAATNSTSGDIYLDNTGNLSVNGVGVNNVNGSVYLTGTADITLISAVTASYIEITANGSILDDNDAEAYDVVSTGNAKLTATTGTIGIPSNAVEVNVTNSLSVFMGGSTDQTSANIKGHTFDGLIEILNVPPGLVLFNNRVVGGDPVILNSYYQAISLLDIDSSDAMKGNFAPDVFGSTDKFFVAPESLISGFGYAGGDLERSLLNTDSLMIPSKIKSLINVQILGF